MDLGKRLRLCRKKAALTQQELGRLAGLAESTISLYETGKRSPDTATLNLLASRLNVSVSFLLGNVAQDTHPELYPFTEKQQSYPINDLNHFLQQPEILFNGTAYHLTDEERSTVIKALEIAFYAVEKRNKKNYQTR